MNHFFAANDIDDREKQRSIFLVCVGTKTYKLEVWRLEDSKFGGPRDSTSHTFEELKKISVRPLPAVAKNDSNSMRAGNS